ncbi:hypothetical protein FTUN_4008 [Frigoriglobus tundricola]|uniref:Uncharacterized protein n=1 Tax=Frigoriglobus tundricola TaxID=2774151 RepID=A0A6M5YT49_9BACT|nr:hypothetical protein FTUN_4008 [Frigoriglobus tundricola]
MSLRESGTTLIETHRSICECSPAGSDSFTKRPVNTAKNPGDDKL